MAKKVYLSPSDQTKNYYAYGDTTEAIQCGKIAEACRKALTRCGVEVMVGQYDTMTNRCRASDAFGADLHVPIHTNAYNGKVGGTRVFCYNKTGEGHKAAMAVFNALAPITPGTSESVSVNANLFEVRVPAAPTVYVECDFHDVPKIAKWIIANTNTIGEAIARGICNYFGIKYKTENKPKPTPAPTPSKKSIDEIAREVIAGKWGNGADRKNRLTKAGYDYDAVQNRVNEMLGKASKPSKKSVDEIAREVIAGKWGNGQDRKNRLTKAGYDYNAVQKRVNEMLGKLPQPSKKSIDEIAREVILGEWGNGADRKNRLTKAGYDYDAVQNRVNELMHK